MRGSLKTLVLGGLGGLALGLAAWYFGGVGFWAGEADNSLLRPADRETVTLGALVYAAHCAVCHGAQLEGEADWQTPNPDGTMPAPPHDATGHTWHHSSELLFAMTKYGVAKAAGLDGHLSNMPGYRDILSDEEIIAVLSFIKSSWPAGIRARHDALDDRLSSRN
ncbi:cbb3-type cytochrome c oxidase subunit III [Roseibium hamelinense]|uniref:Cbb3-type cytochrome c oxidase subunit III n=1 Tax=Roseibium hamelinense TaxID=150831 RepID=A0A562TAG2_9HYPH|nr:cytochrome c [Roseibium hamelinense]MTI45511.1 cytochrome c [Roseibium hamelinense]TWI90114.1 cbb3-type cytochrome c oxidase subunit III [Roseibium hamelinense]